MTTHPHTADQGQLLPELLPGDASSLEGLLEGRASYLEEQIEKNLGPRLREIVEPDDVLQEVRVRILRTPDRVQFGTEARLRGWLGAVVRNCIIDLHRRHFRCASPAANPQPFEDADSTLVALGLGIRVRDSGPSSVARLGERQALLQRILGELRPDQRRLLERVHFDHQPLPEIAAQDGASPGALRMRYRRAIEACRRTMNQMTRGAGA